MHSSLSGEPKTKTPGCWAGRSILPDVAARRRDVLLAELLAWVDDVCATVLGAGCVVAAGGFFFTVADGFHLAVFHALYFQGGDNSLSALLAQGQVVLCAAAFIGVAFDFDRDVRIGRQELAVVGNQGVEFRLDGVLVEVEEDAAVLVDRAAWVQVGWQGNSNWRGHWRWSWCRRRNFYWLRSRCWGDDWGLGAASAQNSQCAGCQQEFLLCFHGNAPEMVQFFWTCMGCEAWTPAATDII